MDPWKVSGFLEDGRAKWMLQWFFSPWLDRFRGTLRIGLFLDPFHSNGLCLACFFGWFSPITTEPSTGMIHPPSWESVTKHGGNPPRYPNARPRLTGEPGDSIRDLFIPWVGGHLTFPKGHVFTIPKRSQRIARKAISFYFFIFVSVKVDMFDRF